MKLFEGIRRTQQTIDAARERSYSDLVREAAEGDNVEPADAFELLQSAGKTIDEFESDVAMRRKLNEARERWVERDSLVAKRVEIAEKQQAELDRFEPIRLAHENVMAALLALEQQNYQQLIASDAARSFVITNSPKSDEELFLQQELQDLEGRIFDTDYRRNVTQSPERHDALKRELEGLQQRKQEIREQLAEIDAAKISE